MELVENYQNAFLNYLKEKSSAKEPRSLYDPIDYILDLGGKRLRPVLVLMTADAFGDEYLSALDAALAIELFHNFTLIHDDIMDDAPLRRGKESVHQKWDVNTGILSGDAMLIMAYKLFESYSGHQFKSLLSLFSKTALEVCEGQQYDIDFEERRDVTVAEYLKMIEYKTAVLVAAAMEMGSIIAKATIEDQEKINAFGKNLGLAFQLQDDYLDAFGNPETFGKQLGGDIIENKKTFLYIKALEASSSDQKQKLQNIYSTSPADTNTKIEIVKHLFEISGAAEAAKNEIENFTHKAFSILETITLSKERKLQLTQFGSWLMTRNV